MKKTQLVIIDAQNDFCDLPESYCPKMKGIRIQPSLPIAGSHQDCLRIAAFISKAGASVNAIDAFMDTHHYLDIGNFIFWLDENDKQLAQATKITLDDILAKKYKPKIDNRDEQIVQYFQQLEKVQLDAIYTWPVHCQIGTFGHAIHQDVLAACSQWENNNLSWVNFIQKGVDPWSEHYSALKAEVEDLTKPSTLLKRELVKKYAESDMTIFVGEASSHCVSKTILDVVNNINNKDRKNMVILTDCMSAIPGYEEKTRLFFKQMSEAGVRVTTSDVLLSEIK